MIWTDDYLFLHYPKAAGKSLSVAFVRAWGGRVSAYISRAQTMELGPYLHDGSTLWIQGAHQNAVKASQILASLGRNIHDLKAVFLGIRHPYELICSTYFFHRKSFERGSKKANFNLAATTTLPEFIRQWDATSYEPWMNVRSAPLKNLRIIRFESMAQDFEKYAKEFGFRNVHIPHLNANEQRNYGEFIDPELEEIIYNKYKLLFDLGYYERYLHPEHRKSAEPGLETTATAASPQEPKPSNPTIENSGTAKAAGHRLSADELLQRRRKSMGVKRG